MRSTPWRRKCLVPALSFLLTATAAGILPAAEIEGPETVQEGQLLVLEGVGVEGNSRWILPDEYDGRALKTATHLALIPINVGALEIILVTANGDEIGFARHNVRVSGLPVPKAPKVAEPRPEPETKPAPEPATGAVIYHDPKKMDLPRRTAKNTGDPRPMVVFYSMPPENGRCEPCEKWIAGELPSLTGFTYAVDKSGNGITRYPSFEIRAGGHSQFVEGYQTADQLKAIAKKLEAL